MKMRKLIAGMVTTGLLFGAIVWIPQVTKATDSYVATDITSIVYRFDVSGIESALDLQFTLTSSSWTSPTAQLTLTQNGQYSFGFTLADEGITGLYNVGYIPVITTTGVTASLTEILVNNQYSLTYQLTADLDPNSGTGNGLANIWQELPDGIIVASGTDGYIKLTEGTFKFYTVSNSETSESSDSEQTVWEPETSVTDETSYVDPSETVPEIESTLDDTDMSETTTYSENPTVIGTEESGSDQETTQEPDTSAYDSTETTTVDSGQVEGDSDVGTGDSLGVSLILSGLIGAVAVTVITISRKRQSND